MKNVLIVLGVLIVLAILGFAGWRLFYKKDTQSDVSNDTNSKINASAWQEKGVIIPGQYTDADVVEVEAGKYRIYYSVEPEASKNLEVYSSTSIDGITWTKEDGVRKTMAVFPDVVKLADNSWRMYFQNNGEIKSAISSDGLVWQDEPGVRINSAENGYNLESVGAQSTTRLQNGDYIMVYRGTINEPYQTTEKIPNQNTQIYFWAISKDGLNFEKKGLAIDSRNETLYGLSDGADWVNWDDGSLRVYFWSYAGVYHVIFENNKFSEPIFDYSNNKDANIKFAPNPPCDPTLIKIKNTWYMFYGQHGQGIYYATLES